MLCMLPGTGAVIFMASRDMALQCAFIELRSHITALHALCGDCGRAAQAWWHALAGMDPALQHMYNSGSMVCMAMGRRVPRCAVSRMINQFYNPRWSRWIVDRSVPAQQAHEAQQVREIYRCPDTRGEVHPGRQLKDRDAAHHVLPACKG